MTEAIIGLQTVRERKRDTDTYRLKNSTHRETSGERGRRQTNRL